MKTITQIPENITPALHAEVCEEYGCAERHIDSIRDTDAKFMAVFILRVYHNVHPRTISDRYLINPLFVPTVVNRIVEEYVKDEATQACVMRVLNKMDGYGC